MIEIFKGYGIKIVKEITHFLHSILNSNNPFKDIFSKCDMEKAYVVDFVLGVMQSLSLTSSSKPVLFQRDDALFVASRDGFGYVTPGLRTTPEKIESWERRNQSREILESMNIITGTREGREEDCEYVVGEEQRISPILTGPDSSLFSLKDMFKTVLKLSSLEDDGKIRMVSQSNSYHSHKHGYACDGTDVWVNSARTMPREKYLDIMRQREDELVKRLADLEGVSEDNLEFARRQIAIPQGVIFTRNLKVSLPIDTPIIFEYRRDSWTETTELGKRMGDGPLPPTHNESPYSIVTRLNTAYSQTQTAGEYKTMRAQTMGAIDRELLALEEHMDKAEEIVKNINDVHNKVCAKNISFLKQLRTNTHKQ